MLGHGQGFPLPHMLHVPQELEMGSQPSTNPTVQAPEWMDALTQSSNGCSDTELKFLCWQPLAYSFFFSCGAKLTLSLDGIMENHPFAELGSPLW